MTEEKLQQLNELNDMLKRIKSLEKRIDIFKTLDCELIQVEFDTGPVYLTDRSDFEIIEKVRALILEESEKQLQTLKSEFESI